MCEASGAAFVEPVSGKLPSVVDKVEDISINKLKMKGSVREGDDLNLSKFTSQEPSSMEKSVDEGVKKSKHPKGKTPGVYSTTTFCTFTPQIFPSSSNLKFLLKCDGNQPCILLLNVKSQLDHPGQSITTKGH